MKIFYNNDKKIVHQKKEMMNICSPKGVNLNDTLILYSNNISNFNLKEYCKSLLIDLQYIKNKKIIFEIGFWNKDNAYQYYNIMKELANFLIKNNIENHNFFNKLEYYTIDDDYKSDYCSTYDNNFKSSCFNIECNYNNIHIQYNGKCKYCYFKEKCYNYPCINQYYNKDYNLHYDGICNIIIADYLSHIYYYNSLYRYKNYAYLTCKNQLGYSFCLNVITKDDYNELEKLSLSNEFVYYKNITLDNKEIEKNKKLLVAIELNSNEKAQVMHNILCNFEFTFFKRKYPKYIKFIIQIPESSYYNNIINIIKDKFNDDFTYYIDYKEMSKKNISLNYDNIIINDLYIVYNKEDFDNRYHNLLYSDYPLPCNPSNNYTYLMIELLLDNLINNSNILDIGSGKGLLSLIYYLYTKNNKITCIDYDKRCISIQEDLINKNGFKKEDFVLYNKDFNELKNLNSKYDLIISNMIYEINLKVLSLIKNLINKDTIILLGGFTNKEEKDFIEEIEKDNFYIIIGIYYYKKAVSFKLKLKNKGVHDEGLV